MSIFKLESDKGGRTIVAKNATKPFIVHAGSRTLVQAKKERNLPKAKVDEEGDWKEFKSCRPSRCANIKNWTSPAFLETSERLISEITTGRNVSGEVHGERPASGVES